MAYKLKDKTPELTGFRLLVIVSNLKDYQLAHFINLGAGLHFKKFEDFPYATKSEECRYYSWYHYLNKEDRVRYYLIENKSEKGFLFRSLKKIDFLLFIKDSVTEETVKILEQKLNQIRGISIAFSYEISVLKEIQVFFDAMELHELDYVIKPNIEPTYRQLKRGLK